MTDWIPWFRYQLKASADGFECALSRSFTSSRAASRLIPPTLAPVYWRRHVWHVTEYERCLALPSMIDWLDIPQTDESWPDDDEAWAKVQDRGFDALIANFRRVRQQQIDLLDQLKDVDWDAPRETLWRLSHFPWWSPKLSSIHTSTAIHS